MNTSVTCRDCGWTGMTWAEQRRQFGRVVQAGLTIDEAKTLMPRCQRCTTIVLRSRGLRSVAGPHLVDANNAKQPETQQNRAF